MRSVGIVLVFLAGLAGAQSIRRNGYVTDDAGVIDHASQDRIVALLDAMKARTGYDAGVVTVRTAPSGVEAVCDSLMTSWNRGDLGFVILVAVQDRETAIASCDQLQGVLTAGYWDQVSERHLKPHFRVERYGEGLVAAVEEISGRVPMKSGSTTSSPPRSGGGWSSRTSGASGIGPTLCPALACLVMFLLVIGVLNAARRWTPGPWGGGGSWARPYGGWGGGWGGGVPACGPGRPWGYRRTWNPGWGGGGWTSSSSSGWSSGGSSWGSSSSSSGGSSPTTYSGSVHKSSW